MHGTRNVRGGLMLLFLGVAGGLAMSLYAFEPLVTPPAGFTRYDDLPRRLIRLAHIAAVMLPLLNIALGPWLDRLALPPRVAGAASWLLLAGAIGLPTTLVLEALSPLASAWHPSAVPANAFVGGLAIVAFGAWRTDFEEETVHARTRNRGADREASHRDALQDLGGGARSRHASS